jgi:sacsin
MIGGALRAAGILMEMLQNADDAGATELKLLLDSTFYPTDSTLGPGMANWQGPALLAFNDAKFSPEDYRNISRIGQDSKLSRPGAIGRFGLGFNIVYNLTDVPSFVSGDYLVTFDPHAR